LFSRIAQNLQVKIEKDLRILRYLFLEITRICNLSCRHCGSDCISTPDADELSARQWIDFLTTLKKDFPTDQTALIVTGGEPLARPDFFEIASETGRLGYYWGIVSNGYLLSEPTISKLVEYGIRCMTISLDGLEDTHNYIRSMENGYQQLLQTIGTIASINQVLFDIVTCVYPGNLPDLDRLAEELIRRGVTRWRLFSITAKGRAEQNRELILSPDQWQTMIDWIKKNRRSLKKAGLEVNFSCEGYFKRDVDKKIRDFPYFCRAGINIASVLCDGSIMACPNISHELIQGSILTDNFKDVWENGFKPYYEREWLKKGRCATCTEWKRCQGNSLHLYDDFSHNPFCHFHTID
jgi:radical SAM protein with 4Fe4S-binding SPASM domain